MGIISCYCGNIADGERLLQPLRKFGSPVVDGIQALAFPVMQSLLGPSFPDGNQNDPRSTLQRELTDDAIAAIVDHANSLLSPLSLSFSNTMGAPLAEFRAKPPHSRTATCRGIFYS